MELVCRQHRAITGSWSLRVPYVGVDSGWHADFYRCVGSAHFSKAVFPPGLRCNDGVRHTAPPLGRCVDQVSEDGQPNTHPGLASLLGLGLGLGFGLCLRAKAGWTGQRRNRLTQGLS